VFVAGGVTYSEVREAYQLSSSLNKDIHIGSTHTLTPRQFVDDLKVLDLGGVGSRALPNGLHEGRGGHRPFQDYYDEKYYTKDAPPPQRPTPAALAPPRQAERSFSQQPSPSQSFAGSTNSLTPSAKDDKKKKKGLFRF